MRVITQLNCVLPLLLLDAAPGRVGRAMPSEGQEEAPMVLRESQTSQETCRHHWIIAAANGPVSAGFCQYCFETREFKNCIDDWPYAGLPNERKTLDPVLVG